MNSKRKNRGKYSPPLCTLRRRRIPCWNISTGVSSAFQSEGCISVPPLEKASFPFPLVAQEKRSIPLSIAREKMRFPFEFLHLNEARGIRTKTRIYIYIYTKPCFEFVRANYRSPSSRPCYSPPLGVDRFLPLFNPGDRLARWFIYFLVFRPPSTSPPPSPCSSSSSCSHSSPVSFHFRLLVPFSTSSPLTRRCRRFRLDIDVAQEPPISGNWLRRHGGLDECSIQSFHFFSFPWEQLLLFPSSLLFPSFILFMRFPFPFFSPRRRRFETTRCHCAKRSLKEDEGIEFATVSFAIQFFMRILRNVYRRGKCVNTILSGCYFSRE